MFASPGFHAEIPRLLEAAGAVLGTRAIVGSVAHGVIGAGREQEGGNAVSILAVSGLDAQPLWVPDVESHGERIGEEIEAQFGGSPRAEDLVVLIPDPRAALPEPLLGSLREVLAPACTVGAGAADPLSEEPLQWSGRHLESGALAGLVLRGSRPPRIGVTQACRPITPLMKVTRANGPWILELDGRRALDVYREVARQPLADDLRRAASFVLAALPKDPKAPLEPGGYLVRNVAGFAVEEGAFAIPETVAVGDELALVMREPETARDDLKAMLRQVATPKPPGLALYFDCCARGAGFFGVPGLESAYLSNALANAPLAGMFGSCELGPVGGRLELLTYTGVLALLDH
jgi:small ligand-binding sensory domain FIST